MFRNKDVIVIPDETMDIKNRKVLNILVGLAEQNAKPRLVSTTFIEHGNAKTISKSLIETFQSLEIPLDNVVCLKSDNVAYMLACGKTLLGICPR
jgi:hypothetical protein